MDKTDKVLPTNTALSNILVRNTPQPSETKVNVTPIVERLQQIRTSLTGRCLVLRPEACIPVHIGSNGIPNEDISTEGPCYLYDHYFTIKNKRCLNLALVSNGMLCPTLELKVLSNVEPENDLESMYVELFRGSEYCVLLKVAFVCPNNGTWTVTCEAVSMEVMQRVRQFYEELAKANREVAERKIMHPTVKY